MYEQFKSELVQRLVKDFDVDQIKKIMVQLDMVANNYEINKTCTELVVYNSNLPQLCETYLAIKGIAGFSEKTLYGYKVMLKNFFESVKLPPEKVTANHIRVYLYEYQQARKVSNASLERVRICLHTFYEWLTQEDYIDKNPVNKVQKIKCEKKQKHALKPIELEYLRQACKTPREKALIEFFYSTGCRVGELVIIKKDDVDWQSKEVHLFGKGKKHRTSYMNAKCEVALKEYLMTRDDDNEYLFVSERKPHGKLSVSGVEKIVREITNRKGIKTHCTPHVFRHTTATTALKNGMPIEEIQQLLGHENIATTTVYAETNKAMVKIDHEKYVI